MRTTPSHASVRLLGGAILASSLVAGLLATSPASADAAGMRQHGASCQPAGTAGSGGFLAGLGTVCEIASTVPTDGDLNPYGVAVVPRSVGHLVEGDVLVSNFNAASNEQGTGGTIMEISPSGAVTVFSNIRAQLRERVGLTTALAVFSAGYVVVGSLPTRNGMASTATAGALYVLDSHGKVVERLRGPDVNGPWDMASLDHGGDGVLVFTDVLNGTVAANGSEVFGGDVVRYDLDLTANPPTILHRQVIGSGFPERTDPNALVIGPTGVALSPNGTVYVADTLANRIAAIPDGLSRSSSDGRGTTVSSGGALDGPLGLTLARDGDLLATNGGNGDIVEITPSGAQIESTTLDSSGSPPGAGALFGLAVAPGARRAVYFVDDASNTLDILK